MTITSEAWYDTELPDQTTGAGAVEWRLVGGKIHRYPLWFNTLATIVLLLVPIGLLVATTIAAPLGAGLMMVGFILISITGAFARTVSRNHLIRHGRTR